MPEDIADNARNDATTLRQMIMGFRTTQLIYVAAKLGIADHLSDGPQPVDAIAKISGAHSRSLYRLLRALACLGLLFEEDDGSFSLTPSGQLLRAGAPGSLHNLAILYGAEWLWTAYGQMLYSVQTGEPAFGMVHGLPLYSYLDEYPTAASQFNEAMSSYSDLEAAAILTAYDFSSAGMVIDVGGGQGALVSAVLQAHPDLFGVVFDLAPVTATRITARAEYIAGDFFTSVPHGGDIYLLKSVLHNWDDTKAIRILRNCRKAMAVTARLLVIERVIQTDNSRDEAKLFDINMLVVAGGQERTEQEYRALLSAADFNLTRIIPTRSHLSIIEGVPLGTHGAEI